MIQEHKQDIYFVRTLVQEKGGPRCRLQKVTEVYLQEHKARTKGAAKPDIKITDCEKQSKTKKTQDYENEDYDYS